MRESAGHRCPRLAESARAFASPNDAVAERDDRPCAGKLAHQRLDLAQVRTPLFGNEGISQPARMLHQFETLAIKGQVARMRTQVLDAYRVRFERQIVALPSASEEYGLALICPEEANGRLD